MADRMRVNYFFRQFLQAEDFIADQTYHRDALQSLTRNLFSAGVAEGLEVTIADVRGKGGLSISEGLALDAQGRQIVLPKTANLAFPNREGQTIILAIAYTERFPDNADDEEELAYQQEVDGKIQYARVIERPKFILIPNNARPNPDHIPLARVHFDGNSAPSSVDNSVRSAVVTKGTPKPVAASAPTIIDTIDGDFTVRGNLRLDGALQTEGSLTTAWVADNLQSDVQITRENQWMAIDGMQITINLPRPALLNCNYLMNVQPNRRAPNIIDAPSLPVASEIAIPDDKLYIVSTSTKTNRIREAPRTNGKIVGDIATGEIVEVIEARDEALGKIGKNNEWVQVRTKDNEEGYTAAWLYRIQETSASIAAEAESSELTGQYESYMVQQGDTLGQIIVDKNLADGWAQIAQVVDLVKIINDLSSSTIVAGTRILLPRNVDEAQALGNDYLALRLVIDDTAYPQSASHSRPVGLTAPPNVTLSGTIAIPLDAGQHVVTLEWYKAGTALSSWTCATASLGTGDAAGYLSGRSLVATAYY